MEQNLHELFGRALADEPPPAAGSVREAMAHGRRIRRRRWLAVSGSTAAAVIALAVGINVILTPQTVPTPGESALSGQAQQGITFLRVTPKSSGAERLRVEEILRTDPAVLSWQFRSSKTHETYGDSSGIPTPHPLFDPVTDLYWMAVRDADVQAFTTRFEEETGETVFSYKECPSWRGQASVGCVLVKPVRSSR